MPARGIQYLYARGGVIFYPEIGTDSFTQEVTSMERQFFK